MNQVLVGGLAPGMADLIERHLPDVTVQVAETGREVLEQLAVQPCQLLVLDDHLPEVPAVDVLRRLTESAASSKVPVIYCLPPDRAKPDFREHAEKLGVRSFLEYPFDVEELLANIAGLLHAGGYHLRDRGEPGPERFSQAMARPLELLDRTAVALLEGVLDEPLLARARAQARELSGLMISIGRLEAARLARDIELLLDHPDLRSGAHSLRLSELVVELRTELDRPIAAAESSGPAETRPLFLLFDRRREFADTVSLEADARGLRFHAVDDAAGFRDALRREQPAVILMDLDSVQDRGEALALLGEASDIAPHVPILVATAAASLASRVAAARAGAWAFLRKPLSAGSTVDAVIGAIRRTDVAGHRVLAVADDGRELAELQQQLEPMRIELIALNDARLFWETLEAARPDVVILDMNTRHHSGLELCRVLRADERWAGVPVMIMGDGNGESMHLAYLAGADDFVARPVLASELVTRLANRLERLRLAQQTAGFDPLTGLMRRRRAEEAMQTLIRLAGRYRKPFSLAAINVDGLREVNESCGHAAGDAVLRRLSRWLRNSFRLEDVIAATGGDNFVLGALGLDKDDCVRRLNLVAERFRQESFQGGENTVNVTFSAGVAGLFFDGVDLSSLQHAAEDTLAFAKSMGGATVISAGWTPSRSRNVEIVDIALVERDAPLAGLLLHALEQSGWTTKWLRDAEDATAQLCGSWPQVRARVILLEVDLAGRDGFAVLRALARDDVLARSRVIMLTARANEPEVLKAFELGAFDHVAKPFSVQVLLQRIRHAIQT